MKIYATSITSIRNRDHCPTTPNKPPFSLPSLITRQRPICTIHADLMHPLDVSGSWLTPSPPFLGFLDLFRLGQWFVTESPNETSDIFGFFCTGNHMNSYPRCYSFGFFLYWFVVMIQLVFSFVAEASSFLFSREESPTNGIIGYKWQWEIIFCSGHRTVVMWEPFAKVPSQLTVTDIFLFHLWIS